MGDESADQGGQRSELQWTLIDDACSRFEAAWQTGQPPQIDDFLPADSTDKIDVARRNFLLHLAGIDLEWRWKTAGEPIETLPFVQKPSPPAWSDENPIIWRIWACWVS